MKEEQVLDFVLPTVQGHQWSDTQQQMVSPNAVLFHCYLKMSWLLEMPLLWFASIGNFRKSFPIDHFNVIAPAKLNEKEIADKFREWLGKGWFAPDDLRRLAQPLRLTPGILPILDFRRYLTFRAGHVRLMKGRVNIPIGSRSGVELEMFDDVLVQSIKALMKESISPLG